MNDRALMKLLLAEKTADEIEVLRMRVVALRMGEFLHTLCCTKNHETECNFYLHTICSEEGNAHDLWAEKAATLLKAAEITSAERASILLMSLPHSVAAIKRSADLLSFLTVLLPILPRQAPGPGEPSCKASCPSETAESLSDQ